MYEKILINMKEVFIEFKESKFLQEKEIKW